MGATKSQAQELVSLMEKRRIAAAAAKLQQNANYIARGQHVEGSIDDISSAIKAARKSGVDFHKPPSFETRIKNPFLGRGSYNPNLPLSTKGQLEVKVYREINRARAENTAFKKATTKPKLKRLESVEDVIKRARAENTRFKAYTEKAAENKRLGLKTISGASKSAAVKTPTLSRVFSGVAKVLKHPIVRSPIGRTILRPLAAAADVVTTGVALHEGYKAIKADADLQRTKDYNKQHYGSLEAAKRTRDHRVRNK